MDWLKGSKGVDESLFDMVSWDMTEIVVRSGKHRG